LDNNSSCAELFRAKQALDRLKRKHQTMRYRNV